MRVFIAEKPSLAQAIFEGLGGNPKTQKKSGYYQHGQEVVTWCYGHMLELFDPEDYNEDFKKWVFSDLPLKTITPPKLKPKADSKAQLSTILKLIKESTSIVNAADPDEEGCLLVDEILTYAKNTKPVERLIVADLNLAPVKKALANMQPNENFKGWTASALARSLADKSFGYNLTRGCTLKGREKGYQGVLNVGRVQSAVMGLVNMRTLANLNHQESFYYDVYADMSINGHHINAKYQTKESDQIDEKNRLISEPNANHVATRNKGKPALVTMAITKPENSKPPLPLNLSTLQQLCAKQFGYSATETLEIMQGLYETHKLLTYPRTDNRYLSDEHFYQVNDISQAMSDTMPELAGSISDMDTNQKHKAFNASKIEAHHAIVPTVKSGADIKLSVKEKNVYHLVAIHFIGLFYPDAIRNKTKVIFDIEGDQFNATQSVLEQRGWEVLHKVSNDKEDVLPEFDLSTLSFNEKAHCDSTKIDKKKTTPLKYFTESTLLAAMTRAAKFIDDPDLRKILEAKDEGSSDQGSIGTEATRAGILEKLAKNTALISIGKEKGYKEKIWKTTQQGQEFCAALPDEVIKPDISAQWEEKKALIKKGKMTVEAFISDVDDYIAERIEHLANNGINISVDATSCPKCGDGFLLKRKAKKGGKGDFWTCNQYPDCKTAFPDKAGKPQLTAPKKPKTTIPEDAPTCPVCNKDKLVTRTGTKGKFWACTGYPSCKTTYPDLDGQPNLEPKPKFKPSETEFCPQCKKALVRLPAKREGVFWWRCSSKTCDIKFFDDPKTERPNYEKGAIPKSN
ncbi:DNA topoisomerase III [Vibrio sp. S17_S38]|uniref:DNA topoisomerase III n=1 Tax=Vibrio sp. S17_S38 TaxID=2720229 RepID=UPI00168160FA|nr:DNA topoisomerase III [Vibrio sp. S17_S38]MBD1574725.1 DNA topoisomerase III [Vibrio sp. S17_S38]